MKKLLNALLLILPLFVIANEFSMGVYIYDYGLERVAKSYDRNLKDFVDEHFNILSQHGVNTIHLTVANQKKFAEIFLPLMQKYQMKGLLQLDFAYFQPGSSWTEEHENRLARAAGDFIRKYQDSPQIMAFSIREEVPHSEVNKMARYYQKILEYAPEAKFFIVHNNLGAAKDQPVPDPAILGTDRYCFWWDGGGFLASPSFSLNWLRKQGAEYYQEAAKRGSNFIYVSTQGGLTLIYRNLDHIKNDTLRQQIRNYAEKKQMGWQKHSGNGQDYYTCWKYYRMPRNCFKATIWSAVMEGAKIFLCWSYTPLMKEYTDLPLSEVSALRLQTTKAPKAEAVRVSLELGYYTLAGHPGKPNPQLEEFAETAKELDRYGKIIHSMYKKTDSPVTMISKDAFNRAFGFPAMKGSIVILQNADVGTWPYNSRYFFNANDDVRIDDEGNLAGYVPHKNTRDIVFSVTLNPGESVFSFESGLEISSIDGRRKASILPGSGTMIFIGSKKEFEQLFALIASMPQHIVVKTDSKDRQH